MSRRRELLDPDWYGLLALTISETVVAVDRAAKALADLGDRAREAALCIAECSRQWLSSGRSPEEMDRALDEARQELRDLLGDGELDPREEELLSLFFAAGNSDEAGPAHA